MIRDEAVCIRHWDWSETSQTVSLMTREHGIVRGVAKGAKREKGGFSGGVELLTRGEVQARVKAPGTLATLTSWDLLETFPVLRSNLTAHRVSMHVADVAAGLFEEGDPHPRLHDALVDTLRRLQGGEAPGACLVRFQWIALGESGYRPEIDRDAASGEQLREARVYLFSPRHGGLTGQASGAWKVRCETVELLRLVAGGDEISGAPPDRTMRAARLLSSYISEILGRELRSSAGVFGEAPRP